MYDNFTDAENTGAPLVPTFEETTVVEDDEQPTVEYEEVVLSHRLTE